MSQVLVVKKYKAMDEITLKAQIYESSESVCESNVITKCI